MPETSVTRITEGTIQRRQEQMTPVLDAFKEFLEAERRRARLRTLSVTAFSLFIILLVSASAFWIGLSVLKEMRHDMNMMQVDVDRVRNESTENKTSAGQTVLRISTETAKLSSLLTNQAQSHQEETAKLQVSVTAQKEDIERLRSSLNSLSNENSVLRQALESSKPVTITGTNAVAATTPAMPKEVPAENKQPPPPVVAQPVVASLEKHGNLSVSPIASRNSSIEIYIKLDGADKLVSWRLPIPE